jgi:hypothetical protein
MNLRHWPKFNGTPMALALDCHCHWRPRDKPNGGSPLHWVFSNGAPMAHRGSAALRFRSACLPLAHVGGAVAQSPTITAAAAATSRRRAMKQVCLMLDAKDIVAWVNDETKEVMVWTHAWSVPDERRGFSRGHWCDPIGAAYSEWQEMNDRQRVLLMLETAIDLAMQGFPLKAVLTAFAEVRQFRALGSQSHPMARALTSALAL